MNGNKEEKQRDDEQSSLMNEPVFVVPYVINTNNKLLWKDSIKQIIACFIAHSTVIKAGINLAFSAIMLPQLNEPTSKIHITQSEASWIASIVTISLPIGSLLIGPIMDKFGRKKLIVLTALPGIVCWLMLAFAKNVWHLYVARIIAGITGGLTMVSLIYVSEITHPDFRPMLLSLNSVFVAFGILLTCIFGFWFNWRFMAFLFCAMDVFFLIAHCFLPESPLWLLTFKHNPSAAAKSLKWLYPNEQVFEDQYQRILEARNKKPSEHAQVTERSSLLQKMRRNIGIYREPTVYKPLIILFLLFFYQQVSGAYVIIFYAVDLFRRIGGHFQKGLNEFVALVLLGTIRFLISVLTVFISKKIGRRPLLFMSAIGMSVSSFIAGFYMYLTAIPQHEYDKLNITKDTTSDNVPLFCVLSYMCFGSLGILIIPWTLIGELLPVSVRGKLGGFLISIAYVLMFVFVKIFPSLLDIISIEYLFLILSVVNLFGFVFIYCFVPETLGKTFNDIEKHFIIKR